MIRDLKVGQTVVLQDIRTDKIYQAKVNELSLFFIRFEFPNENNPCCDTQWPWFADQGNETIRRVAGREIIFRLLSKV